MRIVPRLQELLDIRDCTVTIHAMGCQRNIAKAILDNDVNYMLSVKDNLARQREEIAHVFNFSFSAQPGAYDMARPSEVAAHTTLMRVMGALKHVRRGYAWTPHGLTVPKNGRGFAASE